MTNRRAFIKSIGLSSVIPFFTRKENNKRLRFAIASDGHFGQEGTPYEMYFKHIVGWLNRELENNGLDLVVFNGDLIHDNSEFLPLVKKYFTQLKMPYYLVRGNHDQVSNSQWQSTWGYKTNHVFYFQDYAFILADTSNESGEYKCADLEWLQEALTNNKARKGIFVFLHISQSNWTTHGVHCSAVMDLVATNEKVISVFHGHDHQEDHVKFYKGKPFLYSGHFGGSWGVEYKGYRIVEFNEDGSLLTYQFNPQGNAKLYPLSIGQ